MDGCLGIPYNSKQLFLMYFAIANNLKVTEQNTDFFFYVCVFFR